MNLLTNFTSPATSEMLRQLGIKVRTNFYWKTVPGVKAQLVLPDKKPEFFLNSRSTPGGKQVTFLPAFTLAELGGFIPWGYFQDRVIHKMPGGVWQVILLDKKVHSYAYEAEARAAYLIDLIKTGKISVDEINHPEKYNAILPSGKVAPIKKELPT